MKDFKNILNPLIYSIGISLINDSEYSINDSDDKDNLILYLNLIILIANNDNYIKQDRGLYNCTEELKRVTFLRNESNYIVGQNNRKILKTIRNSFVHGSGRITIKDNNLIISNDTMPNNPEKNRNTTMHIEKKDLINLLKKVSNSIENTNNNVVIECYEMIEKITSGKELKGKKYGYILLMTLLFSYNKESIYDKFMNFIDYSIDFSDVKVNDTRLINDESQRNIKSFYEDNNMIYKSVEDEILYKKDILKLAKKGYFIEDIEGAKNIVWDPSLMAKDTELEIFIPNNLLMAHLRNAVSHGFVIFKENYIEFNDYDKKNGKYFNIEMPYGKIDEILLNNYFKEGVSTFIETHIIMNNLMYRTSLSISKNSFSEYFSVYRRKFYNMDENEVLNYMIENHKISSYLYENPNNIREFLTFYLPDNNIFILDYICKYYGYEYSEEDYIDVLLQGPKIWYNNVKTGIDNFSEYLKAKDNTYLLSKMLYLKNRYSFESEELIKKSITEEDLQKLKQDNHLTTIYTFSNYNYFEQLILGNYLNNSNELERILCAIIHNEKKVFGQINIDEKKSLEPISINDVYKHSSEYNLSEQMVQYMEKNKLATVITILKNELRLYMLDFFTSKLSDNSKVVNCLKKITAKSQLDTIISLYLTSLMKEEIEEKQNAKTK